MNNNAIDSIIKDMVKAKIKDRKAQSKLDTNWLICYNDGTRNLVLEHDHDNLEDVLQAFADFCKGAGFIFDGFAVVDEDGIPRYGLNPLAKLEAGDDDEDSNCK